MDIQFRRTFDMELVRRILILPQIYPHVTDDSAPAAEDYYPVVHQVIHYVLAELGGKTVGLMVFVPENSICWQSHICMLPSAMMDKEAYRCIGKSVVSWVWRNTACRRLVAYIPQYNRLAIQFARRAGMEQFGRNPMAFLKNGRLHDLVMLGVSQPEVM